MSLDWGRLEEVVERAVRRARSEELREVAEAVKTLADYMKTGFQETNK
ncbi:MAG: microtubule-binding protein, partial [Pyrobaculum sp.]